MYYQQQQHHMQQQQQHHHIQQLQQQQMLAHQQQLAMGGVNPNTYGAGGGMMGGAGGGANANHMTLLQQQQQQQMAAAAAAMGHGSPTSMMSGNMMQGPQAVYAAQQQQQQQAAVAAAAAQMAAQQQAQQQQQQAAHLASLSSNANLAGGGGVPQQVGNLPAGGIPPGPTPLPTVSKSSIIRDVWAENLEEEFKIIRELIVDYPFVAMDTEFPGVVAKPVGSFKLPHEFYYATLRYNVNLLKIIQLGISLLNERGEVPEGCCTWQFNFRFNLAEDTFAQDSIELLKTGGINFDHFCDHGIEITRFSELLYSSGLVLNPEVRWLAFHAGYDFGYLMRGLLNRDLPDKEEEFTAVFHQLFPSVFDIKYVLRQTDIMHSAGLDFLADSLSVRRLGTAHQAGSDSLLTGHSFFKLLRDRLGRQMPYHANGILYGLREDAAASNGALAHNGSSGMMTPSTPPTATPYTPGGSAAGQFPSTPLMNIALHGGARDGKVHHGNNK